MDTIKRLARGMDRATWDALYAHANDTGEGQYSGGENLAPRGSSTAGSAKKMQPHAGGVRGSNDPYTAADTAGFYSLYPEAEPMRTDTMGFTEDRKPAETTRSSVDSFQKLFAEYEPMRQI
jgi:hypothetical protein